MYKDDIVRKHYTSGADFVSDLFSAMEAMGWTLEDNQDASKYRVYSSDGENGDRIKEFIKIDYSSSSQLHATAYYHWDSSSHSGVGTAYGNQVLANVSSNFYGWIYGNKNLVVILTLLGSSYYVSFFGHFPKRFWTTPLAHLTADATSGSNITLTLDTTGDFIAGKEYQIVGASGEGRDRIKVTSITDATHLVIESLPRNYSSGSLFGAAPSTFGVLSGLNGVDFYLTCPYNAAGTSSGSSSGKARLNDPLFSTSYLDPDQRENLYILQPMSALEYNGIGVLGYSDEYFLYAPTGSSEDVFSIGEKDHGVSSGSNDATHLNDTTKNWASSAFQDKVLVITGGPGAGEIHKIASNTATQITIVDSFVTVPDDTSSYLVADAAYRYLSSYNHLAVKEGV